MLIFLLVGIAGCPTPRQAGSRASIVLAATAVTAVVLVFFVVDTLKNAPKTFLAIALLRRARLPLEAQGSDHASTSPAPGDAR